MKFKVLAMVGLVLALTVGQAHAGVILPNLNPGDTYRLVFVTSTTTTATSSLISTYDNLVNVAVSTNSILSQNLTTWTALVSTPTALGNVHSSVGIYGTSTRLYNTQGQYLGIDTELFFPSAVKYDENGSQTTPTNGRIWTGAIHYAAGDNTAWTLGGASSTSLHAINEAGRQSIAIGFAGKGTSYSIYGISGVQTIATSSVPEPASIAIWGLGAIGMMVVRRRHQQKKVTVLH